MNYLHDEYFYKFIYLFRCISSFLSYSAKTKVIDLSKSFSYLTLTSSWEPTFQPLVSPLNWHLIIERCLTKISKNEILYIKEHPHQFLNRDHQPFSRHSLFYKSILNIDPRIRFAPLYYNPIDLIKSANIVFCSSRSSTFIEAYGLNKNVITFGRNLINGNNTEIILNKKSEFKKEKKLFYDSPFFYGNIYEAKETGRIISKVIKSFLKEKTN